MRKMLLRALCIPLGFVLGVGLVFLIKGTDTVQGNPNAAPTVSPVVQLIDKHDCWTGAAPKGVTIPGHVVATKANGKVVYSTRLVGPALEQIFNHRDAGLTVHAFCR